MQDGTRISLPGPSGGEIILSNLTPSQAERLGLAFANMEPWSAYPYEAETLARYFATEEPGARRFAVCRAQNPTEAIGVIGLRDNWLRGPYIQFLGLLPDDQDRGIGSALLNHLETEAIRNGEENLWVIASEFNTRALTFYQRFGFRPVSKIEKLVVEEHTEVLLRKRLAD